MQQHERIYIAGEWTAASESVGMLDVIDSFSEHVVARVVAAGPKDVDRAVAAARAAQEEWVARGVEERAVALAKQHAEALVLGDSSDAARTARVRRPARARARLHPQGHRRRREAGHRRRGRTRRGGERLLRATDHLRGREQTT